MLWRVEGLEGFEEKSWDRSGVASVDHSCGADFRMATDAHRPGSLPSTCSAGRDYYFTFAFS